MGVMSSQPDLTTDALAGVTDTSFAEVGDAPEGLRLDLYPFSMNFATVASSTWRTGWNPATTVRGGGVQRWDVSHSTALAEVVCVTGGCGGSTAQVCVEDTPCADVVKDTSVLVTNVWNTLVGNRTDVAHTLRLKGSGTVSPLVYASSLDLSVEPR